MDLEKLELNQLLLIALGIGILVVLGFLVFLYIHPSQNSVSFSKQFAQDTHSDLAQQLSDVNELEDALLEAEPAFADRPQEDQDEFALNKAMIVSLREELQWLSAREEPVYRELSSTEDNLRVKALLEEEAALFSLAITVMQINDQVAQTAVPEDRNDVLDSVDAILDELRPVVFLSQSTADAIASETGLDANAMRLHSKQVLGEFLSFKKQRYATAPKGSMQQFIEAFKLTGWYFSLQAMDTGQ